MELKEIYQIFWPNKFFYINILLNIQINQIQLFFDKILYYTLKEN